MKLYLAFVAIALFGAVSLADAYTVDILPPNLCYRDKDCPKGQRCQHNIIHTTENVSFRGMCVESRPPRSHHGLHANMPPPRKCHTDADCKPQMHCRMGKCTRKTVDY